MDKYKVKLSNVQFHINRTGADKYDSVPNSTQIVEFEGKPTAGDELKKLALDELRKKYHYQTNDIKDIIMEVLEVK